MMTLLDKFEFHLSKFIHFADLCENSILLHSVEIRKNIRSDQIRL